MADFGGVEHCSVYSDAGHSANLRIILLLLEEKAGMRASKPTNFSFSQGKLSVAYNLVMDSAHGIATR